MARSLKALVLSGFGVNCEDETAAALRLAGAESRIVHLNLLMNGHEYLHDYDLLVLPGGFSFGDDLGSGKILAQYLMQQKNHRQLTMLQEMEIFLSYGKFIVGICNGFQALIHTPLLPGNKRVSLTHNRHGHFENRWVRVSAPAHARTKAFRGRDVFSLPVRHGEGRLAFKKPEDFEELVANGQACLFFCDEEGQRTETFPLNPNGSPAGCTALSDTTGQVLGMMPHPEAALSFMNHPDWPHQARVLGDAALNGEGDGLTIFKNILQACQESRI